MIIPAVKANGNLNSFIIIDKKNISNLELTESNIKKISISYKDSYIDGIVIIKKISQINYKVDYYNNDGTWETMCVNGARCVAMLLNQKKIIEEDPIVSIIKEKNNSEITEYKITEKKF